MRLRLIDLLEVMNESETVIVFDHLGDEIARYDGKDSIPEVLNDCVVYKIFTDPSEGRAICIELL